MKLARLALPLALALIASTAVAQVPMDPLDARDARRLDRMEQVMRELRAIVFQGRDTGKPVVVQPAETDYQLQEVSRRLADMEQTMTRMTGDLENAGRQAELAKREAEALRAENKSLSDRIANLESGALAATGSAPADGGLAGGPAPNTGLSAGEAFSQSRQAMLAGDYAVAEAGFRDYVSAYGDSAKAPEARYWLGKTLTARGAHADAAGSYIAAIRGWPQTSWAPDAVLELSRALIALKKPADACQTLAELARRYPKASTTVQTRAAQARTQAKCSG
ncbi:MULTISPECIES: tol-pal system protein YbgF [unclassified Phenylobacterium]|uniref:tol-pal system protein YbgF n=1 Tax=unclassified Phenylobacterium TaxID=2640670 RepID=UPI0022B4596B|nr:tol-pal system protein YbgF [Phenylobacterium sp. NIBR 498073]MBS0492244.1 tol-pal system protein YbgF [Pseudomonadota bacterium]WGU39784.1 tol-pal system protein YbgF [Phenylobacterium sp. NIBR 498073]